LQRVLSTVTLLGLLVATAAAFAITEHLKLIKSPISGTRVSKLISPVCGCATAKATISVRLRRPDRLTVTILDSARHVVSILASNAQLPKGRVRFVWHGRTETGAVAPEAVYHAEIHLANSRRTILLPNRIVVDTTPPKVLSVNDGDGVLIPGGNNQIALRYVLSKQAHAFVFLDRHRIIRGRRSRPHAAVKWRGTLPNGRIAPAGRYVLEIGARDLAGNETPAAQRKQVVVVIRYVVLSETRIHVRAGARFTVGVRTASPRYTWRLARKHGAARGKVLRLRAPSKRGRYRLAIAARGHVANAIVIVGRK
jgi:hypothetical protein